MSASSRSRSAIWRMMRSPASRVASRRSLSSGRPSTSVWIRSATSRASLPPSLRNPSASSATRDRYHGDPTNRPNPSLGAIERPPFYAAAVYPSDVGTAGGLVTDADARVLRGDGSVIEGLYATGNSTASVMGRTYPGAGASIGASFVFGYRAARHATSR